MLTAAMTAGTETFLLFNSLRKTTQKTGDPPLMLLKAWVPNLGV